MANLPLSPGSAWNRPVRRAGRTAAAPSAHSAEWLPRGAARLVVRALAPRRDARPRLGHALAQLARIGAVARPAFAGFATALHLALAGLGHALRDLFLAALVTLFTCHGAISERLSVLSPQ